MGKVVSLGHHLLNKEFRQMTQSFFNIAKQFHIRNDEDCLQLIGHYETVLANYSQIRDHIKSTYGIYGGAQCNCNVCSIKDRK